MLIDALIQFSRSSPLGAPSEVGGGERGIIRKNFFPRATGVRVGRPQDAYYYPTHLCARSSVPKQVPPLLKVAKKLSF